MKFLCICAYGHSRSVAMCRVLHSRGHGAVAAGHLTHGGAILPLAEWADKVVVMQEHMRNFVPPQFAHKVEVIDIGPDIWSNPYNHELLTLLEKHAEQRGW